jgi:hypothetical protein
VQLIYSPDATTDGAWDTPADHYLDTASGNDVWLADYVFTAGSTWADFPAQSYSGAYSAGYIYGRIFETDTPSAGTWYYEAPVNVAQDLTVPPASPQSYDFNQTPGYETCDQQVAGIPEPSTIMLALVGCLPIVARIIRRRK